MQLVRYSLHRFKRNSSTCLAVTAAVTSPSMSEDEEDYDGVLCYSNEEVDNNNFNIVDDAEGVQHAAPPAVSAPGAAPGRFLTALTYALPPGKTTGTKKAKALLAASRAGAASKKKGLPPPPLSQVSLEAELVAKFVSEIKNEIAKLAGTTQDQLKLDKDKLKLEEVKLKLEIYALQLDPMIIGALSLKNR